MIKNNRLTLYEETKLNEFIVFYKEYDPVTQIVLYGSRHKCKSKRYRHCDSG